MGSLIVADIMLLFFSIYVGLFFGKFHSKYPDMTIGFHVREVCSSKECRDYGNKLASKVAIIVGILFFALIYPICLYIGFPMLYLTILLFIIILLYFLFLFLIVKLRLRKKFNLKNK